ncbi:DUF397 domain-containing protein [Streptomyces sp. B3I8]|uniref:DUF397 domain-containing protein n=1 Tax=Streptomyces sp. B3I8 TaxID=3042303 RepID=UPI00358F3600
MIPQRTVDFDQEVLPFGFGAMGQDGPRWSKSSYSGSGGGDRVEVAAGLDAVYVRDSEVMDGGPVLRAGRGEWAAFVGPAAGGAPFRSA